MKAVIKAGDMYRGWRITYHANAPLTGRWKAVWFGVGMCHSTDIGLEQMIDRRIADEHEANQRETGAYF